MYYKQKTGRNGEEVAVEYLENKNYTILERNFRCKQGEIDIIARKKEEIIFIEVKTRTNKHYGLASEAVNQQKKKHFINSIKYYIHIKNLEEQCIRVDVIEVYIKNKKININHIKQAIN